MHQRACAKTLGIGDHARVQIVEAYGNETAWRVEVLPFDNFSAMCSALGYASEQPHAIIVRGQADAHEYDPLLGVPRRLVENNGIWRASERLWIPIDFDDAPVHGDTTEQQISHLVNSLGAPFAGKSCWYQFTSGHGVSAPASQSMRVRLWFLADAPLDDGTLTRYLGQFGDLGVDTCIYRAVQPIYIAKPTLRGIEDPVAQRTGTLSGFDGDTVCAADVVALTPAARVPTPVTGGVPINVYANDVEIDNAAARILRGATVEHSRHNHGMGAVCELVALGADDAKIEDVVTQVYTQQGRAPDANEVARQIMWARDKHARGVLTTSNPPMGASFPESAATTATETLEYTAVAPASVTQMGAGAPIIGASSPTYGADGNRNAITFLRNHHTTSEGRALFLHMNGDDYVWDGTHYTRKEEAWLPHIIQRMVGRTVDATISAVRREAYIETRATPSWRESEEGDPNPRDLLVFKNGVLNIREHARNPTCGLLPHDTRLFATSALPYEYDPGAKCPRFDAFLDSVFEDPIDRGEYLKMLGYLFLHDNPNHLMFFLSGASRSGKGVTQRLVSHLVGAASSTATSLAALRGNFGLGNLMGKKVAVIGEMNEDSNARVDTTAVDIMKSISGGDTVTIDRKYMPTTEICLGVKFLIACNTFPAIFDASGGFSNRIVLVRFEKSFFRREDRGLEAALALELPGIANAALNGLRCAMSQGFTPSQRTTDVLNDITSSAAPTARFFEDNMMTVPDAELRFVRTEDIFNAYRAWGEQTGVPVKSLPRFCSDLRAAMPGLHPKRVRAEGLRERGYSGPGFQWTPEGNALLARIRGNAPFG